MVRITPLSFRRLREAALLDHAHECIKMFVIHTAYLPSANCTDFIRHMPPVCVSCPIIANIFAFRYPKKFTACKAKTCSARKNRRSVVKRCGGLFAHILFFALDVLVDALGAGLACAHGEDNGGSSGDSVAAREHALARRAAALVGFDAALAGEGQASGVLRISGFGLVPMAMMTVSTSSTHSEPGTGTGLRRPLASGSPSS